MNRLVALLIVFFFCHSLSAQNDIGVRIDSLTKLLKISGDDSNKVITLNQLATAYWELEGGRHSETAQQYFKDALSLSTRLSYRRGYAVALLNKGRYEISVSQKFADATSHLLEALYNFESINDSSGASKCYLQLGVISYITTVLMFTKYVL